MTMLIQRAHPSRAFTLIELVMSLSISSILAVCIASAIMIAARAMPSSRDPSVAAAHLSKLDDSLRGELQIASSIIAAEPTRVEFLVADRDGDEIEERVELSWSGQAGAPLVRRVNAGSPEPVVASVQTLAWNAQYASASFFEQTHLPQISTGSVSNLFSNGTWSSVSPGRAIAIRAKPGGLPAGSRWRPTRIDISLRWASAKPQEYAEIRVGKDVLPVDDPWVWSRSRLESSQISSTGELMQVSIATPWLASSEAIVIAMRNMSSDSDLEFQYKLGFMPVGMEWMSENLGLWVTMAASCISVRVVYEVKAPESPEPKGERLETLSLKVHPASNTPPAIVHMNPFESARTQP